MYYDQIKKDQTWVMEANVTAKMIDGVASAFSDYNPIHMDHSMAVEMGFRTRIFHGIGLTGLVSSAIATHFPGQGSILLKIDASFSKPAYLGDKLKLKLSVISKNKLSSTLKLSYEITNDQISRVAFGNASVMVPKR